MGAGCAGVTEVSQVLGNGQALEIRHVLLCNISYS